MKKEALEAKAINKKTGKSEIVATGECEVFESVKELMDLLNSKETPNETKEKILADLNRQIKTDQLNYLRQSVTRPVSDVTLLKRGLKDGTISEEKLAEILRKAGLKD